MKVILAVAIIIASLLDCWTTAVGISAGHVEFNPLANAFIRDDALLVFATVKMFVVIVVVQVVWRLKRPLLIYAGINMLVWAIVINNAWRLSNG